VAAAAIIVLALAWRHRSLAKRAQAAGAEPIPTVAAEKVDREDLAQTLTVAAEFRPNQQVALHSKVSGYVQSIWVDVGDHVQEGQAIAQLDVPEMQNELQKATASSFAADQEVIRAEAAHAEAHLGFTRLQDVAKDHPKLVAQQEVDAARARDATTGSAVAAAMQKVEESRAEIARVKAMVGYTTITAPFAGVITRRLADPGALIQAGTSSTTQPIVELAEDKKLRLTFPVPESSVPLVKTGAAVRVTVGSLETSFDAAVSRFSGKVDRATRTMWTEVDVDNAEGRFTPGMIAEVALVVRESKRAVAVPVQAIAAGEKPTVMLVGRGDVVEQRAVTLGLQTPGKTEVLTGLQPGDLVLVGARTGVQPGQKVHAKVAVAAAE
jgi:RND family efflux transporter MFP subunit